MFDQFRLLLDNFVQVAGLKTQEQRTDTTMFMSNIRKAGRVSLAFDVLEAAVRSVPEKLLPVTLADVLEKDFRTRILFHSREEDSHKLETLLGLSQEVAPLATGKAGEILVRFLAEQTKEEAGRLVPKENKEIIPGSLQSAYDPDATFRAKAGKKQSGYSFSLTETCSTENDMQLITDYAVNPNNKSDSVIIQERMGAIKETGCADLYADGAYNSPKVDALAKRHDMEIHLTNMTGKKSTKLPPADFAFDENLLIKACPRGEAPYRVALSNGVTNAYFHHHQCQACPHLATCFAKRQKKDYAVRITLKAVRASREREKIAHGKKENTSKRAAVEGSCSCLKRTGLSKLRVVGQIKCGIVGGYMATSQNIKRLIRYCQGGYKPKGITPPAYA